MHPSKRFLFVWWEGGGNMPPALHLVRQLVTRGHQVRVLGEPVSEAAFRDHGADFVSFRRAPHRTHLRMETDWLRDWEAGNPKQAVAILRDRLLFGPAVDYAQDTLDQIHAYAPDALAIMDLTMGAMLAAERAAVPTAVIAPHIFMYPVLGRPPAGPGFLPARHALDRLRDSFVKTLSLREWAKGIPQFNAARAKLGLAPLKRPFEQIERMDRVLVLTSPALELPGGPLPENVRYCGPILVDPCWAECWKGPWPPNEERPLVLVSLSTTFQNQQNVLQRAITALGTLPVRALVTIGPACQVSDFVAPSNVVVCPSAPHSQILPFADLMITHCGHGSVVRALAHGVPLLCLPMGRDQNDTAARVVYHGAGLRLKTTAPIPEFKTAIQRVLANRAYAAAAERLGRAIRADAANCTAVQELEALAAREPADALQWTASKSPAAPCPPPTHIVTTP